MKGILEHLSLYVGLALFTALGAKVKKILTLDVTIIVLQNVNRRGGIFVMWLVALKYIFISKYLDFKGLELL